MRKLRNVFIAWGFVLTVIPGAAMAQSAFAPNPQVLIDERQIAEVRAWLDAPIVRMLTEDQNATTASFDQAAIDALDQAWRAEREQDDQPLIGRIISNPLSAYLLQIQAGSLGLFTEIFVMDARGLNVGQSAITTDYWQGDEAKFQRTFLVAPDAVFIDEAEFHEATATWRAQLNLTIADETGRAIGAVTAEFNLTELRRRAAAGV